MALFYLPIQSAYGLNIDANAGAKLYFYEIGTLIPKTTYSDSDLTIPQTHPVVADSRGRFPAIFFEGGYKLIIKDADDQTISTVDNVSEAFGSKVTFIGDFDSSTNGGDYPANGSLGDLYKVSTGFTLNPTSGSHRLFTGDFIIANKNGATGIDADWDTIKGTKIWLDEDDMISNSAVLAPSQQSIKAYVGLSVWRSTVTYSIGDHVKASDGKLYKSKTAGNQGNDPTGGGDPTNWEPVAHLIDNLTTDDSTRGLTAAQGKILKDFVDEGGPPATSTSLGSVYLPNFIAFENDSVDPGNDTKFSGGTMIFDDGTGEAVVPPYTKQLDVAWASGNNAGMLDVAPPPPVTASYFLFAIHNPTTKISDYLASQSFASPNLPAGYTKKEYRGGIVRIGGSNLIVYQYKNEFILDSLIQVYNGPTFTGTNYVICPSAPDLLTTAIVNGNVYGAEWVLLHPVFVVVPPLTFFNILSTSSNLMRIATQDTTGVPYIAVTSSGATATLELDCYGWVDHSIRI